MLVPVIASGIVVLFGKPIANWGKVAFVPLRTKPVIEFFVAFTRVFKFRLSLLTLGTKFYRPIQPVSPFVKLKADWLRVHSAWENLRERAYSDAAMVTPINITLPAIEAMMSRARQMSLFLDAQSEIAF